jgi:ATP-dependent RNA helicase DOB1
LKKLYGDDERGITVGIMTGDIKFAPQADIVIMTTEILRNLLFKQGTETEKVGITAELSLVNLDAVVFDEVHYINDRSRGNVWEECLILLPPQTNLVLLSATLDTPEPFVNWLTNLKQKPCHLISTEYRVVPLVHQTDHGDILMDSKDQFHTETYNAYVRKYYNQQDELRKHGERVRAREAGQVIEKETRVGSFVDRMNRLIIRMEKPALFFVFSRKMCEEYASKIMADLIDSSQTAEVRHIIKYHLRDHTELEKIEGYHKLFNLLLRGIAFHHSGMLPILKEIVEILFGKGLVKALFATETFAVGINMPTKTVVFTSYRKFDDHRDTPRMLKTSEYTQMAGRAERRGKDDKGIVIVSSHS